jgi:hypothetical protein
LLVAEAVDGVVPGALAAVAAQAVCYRKVLIVFLPEQLITSSLAVVELGQALKTLEALVALILLPLVLRLWVAVVAAQTPAWGLDPAYLVALAGVAGVPQLQAPQAERGQSAKGMTAATACFCARAEVVVLALLAKTAQVVLARAAMVVTVFLRQSQVPQPTMRVAAAAATRLL